ncbi:hypothetical protein [Tabrizicola sp.]|uniref:hypothetical protein n=1 Tax=Tabrizicola sp. TaxID=2005166 RepID=UPI0035AE9FED
MDGEIGQPSPTVRRARQGLIWRTDARKSARILRGMPDAIIRFHAKAADHAAHAIWTGLAGHPL